MLERTCRRESSDDMGRKELEDNSDAQLQREEHIVLKPEELLVMRRRTVATCCNVAFRFVSVSANWSAMGSRTCLEARPSFRGEPGHTGERCWPLDTGS